MGAGWYSRPELNRDQRFRKPLLYPFELRELVRLTIDSSTRIKQTTFREAATGQLPMVADFFLLFVAGEFFPQYFFRQFWINFFERLQSEFPQVHIRVA